MKARAVTGLSNATSRTLPFLDDLKATGAAAFIEAPAMTLKEVGKSFCDEPRSKRIFETLRGLRKSTPNHMPLRMKLLFVQRVPESPSSAELKSMEAPLYM